MEIVKDVVPPIVRQVNYGWSLEENMKILEDKMEYLMSREEDINTELNQAEVQLGKRRKREVEVWQEKVRKITAEVDEVKRKYNKRSSLQLISLGKLVDKKIKEVTELQDKGSFSDGLVVDHLDRGLTLPTTQLVGVSAENNFIKIWNALMDNEINTIGIYGMGGVGKTTIMTHINNKLKDSDHFDVIIWVTISKALNLKRLQNDIAKAIELDLSKDKDQIRRAAKLQEGLKLRKKFVLILDDLWKVFSLEEIGIPIPSRENGFKLIITSRSFEVCRGMNCQREIKVEVLLEEEAWNLFMDKVGCHMVLAPEVEEIARLVAQECARLPLTIITVGGTMRGVEDIHEWRNALNDLKSSTRGVRNLDHKVIKRLKFSYDRLRNEKLRTCFLYCALYPEDYEIPVEELIDHWIAEELIDDERNMQARLDEGHVILNILINNGMLERKYFNSHVKMHDSVRDMALSVSPRSMVQAGDWLTNKPPKEAKWKEDLERVSLMRNGIKELLYSLRYPKLTTLLLRQNPLSGGITDSFFEHMPSLSVLNLSETEIKYLPHSISDLKNLRALLLRRCTFLTDVPSLANLTELRMLDLRDTGIKELPQGMGRLVNLRRLDVSYIKGLRMFPSGLLSMFSFLEDFKMNDSGWWWGRGMNVEELMNSTRLEIFYASFNDLHTLNKCVNYEHMQSLKDFSFTIRDGIYIHDEEIEREKSVRINRVNLDENNSLVLPENTRQLYIQECNNLSILSCLKNLRDLEYCYLKNCTGIEYILSLEDEEVGRSLLPSLNYLSLFRLNKLSALCKGVGPRGTLSSLKHLLIHMCNHIKNLFSPGLLQHLQNLEEIDVWNCEKMENIIEEEEEMGEGNKNTITLPRLKKLELWDLPKLKSIWKGLMVCESLSCIVVQNCEEMKRLPLSMEMENRRQPPLALDVIEGSKEWWDLLEWDHPSDKTLLQPFFQQL